jgi:hypothetical protein
MPPLAVIEPSYVWHRRAGAFSLAFLVLIFMGSYFVKLILLLAPFAAYRVIHAWRFLQPGRVGIEFYDDKLVLRPAFGRPRQVERANVKRFLAVYSGTTEVVVARMQDIDVRGTQQRPLIHSTDVIMPSGLMRNPGLVRRLESWRTGTFSADSLFPESR